MTVIKAPYNFVPLNEDVFTPPDSNQISHDIPFSDGESGCIKIKLTAASPVYVRNGGNWPEDNAQRNANPDYQSFSIFNDSYFIPGTSIKGMIRNVLEIMSFGKMGKGRINNHRFSYRDLSDSDDGEAYKAKINKVKSGWLKENSDGSWQLTPCEFTRVTHDQLHNYYRKHTSGSINLGAKKTDTEYKNSVDKYIEYNIPLSVKFNIVSQKANSLGSGAKAGTLVFTGQPSNQKYKEFIFYSPDMSARYDVSGLKDDFIFIHSNNNGLPNDELEYWFNSGKLKTGEMPVFYLEENGSVHSMGLAMMYRLAFDNRVCDLLPEDHNKQEEHDFADIIFGSIHGEPLKGRIQFSHALAAWAEPMNETQTKILGGPKASYSPTYLQEGRTYREPESKLAGHKRYPVHPAGSNGIKGEQGTSTTQTKFIPLKKGAEFLCKIRFHNLRKAEIGALLSALTFHGHEADLFHSLGMAKPLGCGKMQLTIEEIKSQQLTVENQNDYLDAFVNSIEHEINLTRDEPDFVWARQPQIDELLTMAHEQNNQQRKESELSYMVLDLKNDINEFAAVRSKKNVHLKNYSQLKPGINKISLRTVEDYFDEIEGLLADKQINAVKSIADSPEFLQALTAVLAAKDIDEAYRNLYKRVPYEPDIILKLMGVFKRKELIDKIRKISNPDKTDGKIQELFDGLLAKNIVDPDNIPEWAQPIAYDWEDLNLTDNQLLDEVEKEKLEKRQWPTVASLKTYLETIHKFDDTTDRELCLDAVTEFFDRKES